MLFNTIKIIYNFFKIIFIRNYKLEKDNQIDCCILGNGPSLNYDLENRYHFLESKILFVVNAFAKSDFFEKLKPKYYLLIDPVFWSNNISDIHHKELDILTTIKNKVDWDLYVVVPLVAFEKINTVFKENIHIKVRFYNHTVLKESRFDKLNHFIYSKELATPIFQNVVAASIYCALNSNFKKIYLFGVEHSWLNNIYVNKDNVVCLKEEHFYEVQSVAPLFNGQGKNYKLHELLFDYGNMFLGYSKIEKYSKYKKASVINMTENSFIDSFSRKSYNEIC